MNVKTNFLLALGVTTLVLFACKNDKPAAGQAADIILTPNPDTIVGLSGTDNCGFTPYTNDSIDYFYQKYKVTITKSADGKGQYLKVSGLKGEQDFELNLEGNYTFMGLSRDFLYLDEGTAPDIRQIMIYDIIKQIPVFKDTYCDSAFVASNGKLWFWTPIDKSAVKKLPECSDSAQWVKDGLQCGYAQRKLFDPVSNSLTVKSEFKCFAKQ